MAMVLNSLGGVWIQLRENREALPLIEQAVEIARALASLAPREVQGGQAIVHPFVVVDLTSVLVRFHRGIEVAVERLKRKYGVEVNLNAPKVPYKETIKGSAKAQGKYKKQSGGRGQFADVPAQAVHLILE